ncbi:MAG: hypothetical protein OXC19_21335 [Bryobacterales bacterium]|nr:hypothetical protein [Bryobacterales bacterium]
MPSQPGANACAWRQFRSAHAEAGLAYSSRAAHLSYLHDESGLERRQPVRDLRNCHEEFAGGSLFTVSGLRRTRFRQSVIDRCMGRAAPA